MERGFLVLIFGSHVNFTVECTWWVLIQISCPRAIILFKIRLTISKVQYIP